MPRPARPWYRLYTETFSDRKLRRLPVAQRWIWVALLGAARESPVAGVLYDGAAGVPMSPAALGDYAGVPVRQVVEALAAFEQASMIEPLDDEAWRVVNWPKRQFETDDVTARTRRHRRQQDDEDRNVPTPFPGTPTRSSTERSPSRALATETETESFTSPPSTNGSTRSQPVDNPGAEDVIERALQAAAQRYARAQVSAGKASSAEGISRWWIQENATGARVRAASLLERYDLTETQLADALVSGNPSWLGAYERRKPIAPESDEPDNPEAVAAAMAAARRVVQPWAPESM